MNKTIRYLFVSLLWTVSLSCLQAQCGLLFLKAPDTVCTNGKNLTLRTSRVANAEYVWKLPNRDTVTRDSVLTIERPQAIHSGNYSVSARTSSGCQSEAIGPVKVVVLGVVVRADTAKPTVLVCGQRETRLTTKIIPPIGVKGEWVALTEGVTFGSPNTVESKILGLSAGENKVMWTLSNDRCKNIFQDTFKIDVEDAPSLSSQTVQLRAQDASLILPLASVKGSTLDIFKSVKIEIEKLPQNGRLTASDSTKALKYSRSNTFRGTDNFRIKVCSRRCPTACSPPVTFNIVVDFDELYPNITVPKVLSPQQINGWEIENVRNYPKNELVIYDRWGGIVQRFQNYPDPQTGNWNGTNDGKILSSGAYYFTFIAKADNSPTPKTNFKPLTGIVYIIE